MNAEVFAEWLRRQGHRVVRTSSSYWYDAGLRVFQAFPYHWIIQPGEVELRGLLLGNNGIALRYSTSLEASQGIGSYHVVCEDPTYDLKVLPRQARQNVQRGLQYASIERISIPRLAEEGWPLRSDTLERQGRRGAENEKWWRQLCMSAQGLPGFEAWGAIHDGKLVASFLALICDDCYTLPYEQSATAHLESRVNNALFFYVTREALRRTGIRKVFFCLQSLDAPATVDNFKFRMGYTPAPIRQRVVFHPWLSPFASNLSHSLATKLLRRDPGSHFLAKAEGMLRFSIQGRRPLHMQQWPECLNGRKVDLLGIAASHTSAQA